MQDTIVSKSTQADKGILSEVNHALVALDLSAADKNIIRYLDFFSKHIPVRSAHFLHVVPYFESHDPFFMKNIETLHNIWERNKEIAEGIEKEVRTMMGFGQDMKQDFEIRTGNPLSELLKSEEDSNADLVIIGQKKEESGFGILARNLVRKVKCNAMIIPENSVSKIETILVPIDFSGYSANALESAVNLGKSFKKPPRIVCVHIFGLPNLSIYTNGQDRAKFVKALEMQAEEAMDIFMEKFAKDYSGELETLIIDQEGGPVAPYLFDCAKMEKADLIIMGAKGHSQVERLLIGSVTERMLTLNKEIPTLVVK